MVRCFCIWSPKNKTASLRHCYARHVMHINPQVSVPATGKITTLQVLREAVPDNRDVLSVGWSSVTVDRHEIAVLRQCLLVPTDSYSVYWSAVSGQLDDLHNEWGIVTVQRNDVSNVAVMVSFVQDGGAVVRNTLPFPRRDGPAVRNADPVEQHDISERRNTIQVDTNGIAVGRNPSLVVRDSLREQLSSTTKPLFIAKLAKFHQFHHIWFSHHSKHTHRDAHITLHSIHYLSRRHNASFCSTQQ